MFKSLCNPAKKRLLGFSNKTAGYNIRIFSNDCTIARETRNAFVTLVVAFFLSVSVPQASGVDRGGLSGAFFGDRPVVFSEQRELPVRKRTVYIAAAAERKRIRRRREEVHSWCGQNGNSKRTALENGRRRFADPRRVINVHRNASARLRGETDESRFRESAWSTLSSRRAAETIPSRAKFARSPT